MQIACGILAFVVALQTVAYHILWDLKFLARFVDYEEEMRKILVCRNIAVFGGLLLLVAECQREARSMFAGVPSMGEDNRPKQYMQLAGRILLVFMFMSLMKFELSPMRFIELTVGGCVICEQGRTLTKVGILQRAHALRHRRLQNEAVGDGAGRVVVGAQYMAKQLVEHSVG